MAEQSSQHMSLSAQLTASQTQLSILQSEIERATMSVSAMKAELEVGRQRARDAEDRALARIKEVEEERDARVAEVEKDLRDAESVRRKLHNQVQELKGNIRVFARVRPALRELALQFGSVLAWRGQWAIWLSQASQDHGPSSCRRRRTPEVAVMGHSPVLPMRHDTLVRTLDDYTKASCRFRIGMHS
jgi:hypothetical protein